MLSHPITKFLQCLIRSNAYSFIVLLHETMIKLSSRNLLLRPGRLRYLTSLCSEKNPATSCIVVLNAPETIVQTFRMSPNAKHTYQSLTPNLTKRAQAWLCDPCYKTCPSPC